MLLQERMTRFEQTDLYVVITEAFCKGRSALAVLDEVLAAGVGIVQFREKGSQDAERYRRALEFRRRTRAANALLLVDDRVDIALAIEADGVHLGQSDLPVHAARAVAPELIIGASSHNLVQALAAQEAGASYVNIGPIFPTETKSGSSGPIGPEMIDVIRPHLAVPWTTMGGIKIHNIGDVLQRGARHVAVVTAVTAAEDVRAAASQLRQAILTYRQRSE